MDFSCKESYYRSKSTKSSSYTRIPVRPVWPVRPTGQTGRRLAGPKIGSTGQTAYGYRSDQSANFGRQHNASQNMLTVNPDAFWNRVSRVISRISDAY